MCAYKFLGRQELRLIEKIKAVVFYVVGNDSESFSMFLYKFDDVVEVEIKNTQSSKGLFA